MSWVSGPVFWPTLYTWTYLWLLHAHTHCKHLVVFTLAFNPLFRYVTYCRLKISHFLVASPFVYRVSAIQDQKLGGEVWVRMGECRRGAACRYNCPFIELFTVICSSDCVIFVWKHKPMSNCRENACCSYIGSFSRLYHTGTHFHTRSFRERGEGRYWRGVISPQTLDHG